MPQVRAPDHPPHQPSSKTPGATPLPGYVLIEPLGRGGFGEVWKCEAPGGLHKAIKFVAGNSELITSDETQLRQEYEAFQQVKAIRHPFLLSLERVELVDDELVMVMELADRQLGDRFQECRATGLPGIPRDELIGYLKEAAEALDVIGNKYGLQHLDVKPANLFLLANHVKVGDYGLVSKLDGGTASGKSRGLTPKYAAPEVLQGQVHTQSDQYSLALVYQELLSGTFPFSGRTPQQLMLQHVSVEPDLRGLPEHDRPAVSLALQKRPEDRFASCEEFVRVLAARPMITPELARSIMVTPAPRGSGSSSLSGLRVPSSSALTRGPANADEPTHQSIPTNTPPASPGVGLPRLVSSDRPTTTPAPRSLVTPASTPQARPPVTKSPSVKLDQLQSLAPVEWLVGRAAPDPDRPAIQLVRAVLESAAAGSPFPIDVRGVTRLPDGSWLCRFLTTMDPRVAQVRLDLLWEEGGIAMDTRQEGRVVFRKTAEEAPISVGGLLSAFGKKAPPPLPKSGFEVVVQLPPPGTGIGEVVATANLFGGPPAEFARSAERSIVKLLEGVRRELNNFEDRRKHPRVPATFPINLYPLHSDGRIDPPLTARCKDISVGGLALMSKSKPSTRYMYVAFEGVPRVAGLAVLIQVVRYSRQKEEFCVTGRYRLDLGPESSGKS